MCDFFCLGKCSSVLVVKCWQVRPIQVALQLAQPNLYTILERCLLWYGSFFEKAHFSFWLVKSNLTFRLLQNLLQSWSTFFCVSLECTPINRSLKYLTLISDSVFWELFSFLQFVLSFRYDLATWSIISRGY